MTKKRDNRYRRKVARHCASCLAPRPTTDAPDPCLGWLPGVRFACCGHGSRRMAYVALILRRNSKDAIRHPVTGEYHRVLRGTPAVAKMRKLGGNPPVPTVTDDEIWTADKCWPRDKEK